jgi:rubrerythrin
MAGEEVALGLLALAGLAVLVLWQIPETKSLEEGQRERSGRNAEEIAREELSSRQGPVGTGQPVTKEIYREREIIREIVKIRCRNCGTLFEERLNRCPHCGAPI